VQGGEAYDNLSTKWRKKYIGTITVSAMEQHDVNADPDPTFHF
jgi:hypothetical protein